MSLNVLIITEGYPYGVVERTFLSPELPYLVKRCASVTVAPLGKSSAKVDLVDGVRLDTSLAEFIESNSNLSLRDRLSLLPRFIKFACKQPRVVISSMGVRRLMGYVKNYTVVRKWLEVAELTKVDVVYTYWLGYQTLAATDACGRSWKTVSRCHGYDLYHHRVAPAIQINQATTLQRADRVFPVSKNGVTYLRSRYKNQASKVEVQYMGVDAGSGRSVEKKEGTVTLVSCSSVIPLKRVDYICDVIEEYACSHPELKVRWVHFGGGELLADLEFRVSSMGSANFEVCLEGVVAHEKLLEFYETEYVDLFINLSTTEGVPVSIMEAFSRSIPAVAPDVGGVSEIVNLSNGVLVAKDADKAAVLNAIERVMDQSQILRIGAYETWNMKFNAADNSERFFQALCDLKEESSTTTISR